MGILESCKISTRGVMRYIKFGSTDKNISALGFGTMRLPIVDKNESKIDIPNALKMLHFAYENGINYVDTAYLYHDGNSEYVVGESLKNGYREKVYLADKFPILLLETRKDLDKIFFEQLKKLETDHIDFYLLHSLHSGVWEKSKSANILEWCTEKKKQGLIRHVGFSIHDTFPVFKNILDSYEWEFCQVQYNYMNEDVQVGTKGIEYAYSKNVPVIIMEPLLGGSLVNFPDSVNKIWKETSKAPVEMAFQWLWNKREISIVLSGMSSMEQLEQNIKFASRSRADSLTEKELEIIGKVQDEFKKLIKIPCTKCQYCIDCPVKINIPYIFGLYNDANVYEGYQIKHSSILYGMLENNAEKCLKCRKCENCCPQKIDIIEKLGVIHSFFQVEAL